MGPKRHQIFAFLFAAQKTHHIGAKSLEDILDSAENDGRKYKSIANSIGKIY